MFQALTKLFGRRSCDNTNLKAAEQAYAQYVLSGQDVFSVSPTERNMLSYAPVWQAVSLVSGDLGKVIPRVYDVDVDQPTVTTLNTDHAANFINQEVSLHMGPVKFWRRFFVQLAIYTNAYAKIIYNGQGQPVGLRLMESVFVDHDLGPLGIRGYYYMSPEDGWQWYGANEVVHVEDLAIHETSMYNNRSGGLRLIQMAQDTYTLGKLIGVFGHKFFENGGRSTTGVVTTPEGMPKTAQENFEKSFRKKYEQWTALYKAMILHDGVTYAGDSYTDPDKGQMIESKKEQRVEVAGWWNIPPHKLGSDMRSSYNSLEQENRSYLDSCLSPRFSATADELRLKLFTDTERPTKTIKHDTRQLLQINADTAHKIAVEGYQGGIFTRDEARQEVAKNPAEPDDVFLDPLNMLPSDEDRPNTGNGTENEQTPPEDDDEAEEDSLRWVKIPLEDSLTRAMESMEARLRREYRRNGPHGFVDWFKSSFAEESSGTFDKITGAAVSAYSGAAGVDVIDVRDHLFAACCVACEAKITKNQSIMPKKRAAKLLEGLKNVPTRNENLQLTAR